MFRVGVQRKKGSQKGDTSIEVRLFLLQSAIEHEWNCRQIGKKVTADDGTVIAVQEKNEKAVNFRNDPVSGSFFRDIK